MKKNNRGVVTTLIIFSISVFGIALVSNIIYGIRQQYNNTDYIVRNVNSNINSKIIFIDVVNKLKN